LHFLAFFDAVQATEKRPIRGAVFPTIGTAPNHINTPSVPSVRRAVLENQRSLRGLILEKLHCVGAEAALDTEGVPN